MTTDIGIDKTLEKPKKTPKQRILSVLKTALLYGVIFLVIYSVVNWWRQPVMPADPQLQLMDYQGQPVDLAELSRQQPTLIYFWGTWCSVCSVTSPTINRLAATNDHAVITIAVQSGSNQELRSYLDQHQFDFTAINDQEGDIFADWQGQVTPSYVVLENGKMTQGLTGIQPLWSLKLRLWLASVFLAAEPGFIF